MATIEDYRDSFEPANVFTVPKWSDDDPEITIATQFGGGCEPGTPGVGWCFYEVRVNGEVVEEGNDLSTGTPRTHEQMAWLVAGHWAASVEDPSLSQWSDAAREVGAKSVDRLTDFDRTDREDEEESTEVVHYGSSRSACNELPESEESGMTEEIKAITCPECWKEVHRPV